MHCDADFNLGDLANPEKYREPLVLPSHIILEDVLTFLRSMLLIRLVEQEIAKMVKNKEVLCPCHLGVGQEAVAVGIAESLNKKDRVFGTHRSHAHYLALGGSVYSLFAEVFGYADGCAKGVGGSMHLIDQENGFLGSVPIVAGTIPLAVGASLAAKLQGNDSIGVCFFGDGAAEEGILHESLNLAAIKKLPVLFVCENNLYSSHLDIGQRQPSDSIARFAKAHCIDFKIIDGNDIFAVKNVANDLINNVRSGNGPAFLEAVTYRWLGHVGANEDVDVGVRRSVEDLAKWKLRDPVKRLVDAIIAKGWFSNNDYEKFYEEVKQDVLSELSKAKKASYPDEDKLLYKVYYSD